MFGAKTVTRSKPSFEDVERDIDERARAMFPAIATEVERYRAHFDDEWRADSAYWAFSARRFGDFLSLEVSRGGTRSILAPSIAGVTIIPRDGHPPEDGFTVGFDLRYSLVYGKARILVVPQDGIPEPGHEWRVTPIYPHTPYRPVSGPVDTITINLGGSWRNRTPMCRAEFGLFPGPAQDDTIHIGGLTLRCPAGRGGPTYQAIMDAIAVGYEAPAIAEP